ncbi:putative retrotransposon-like family member retr-1-like protein, partial [Operophtera brumata]
MIVVADGNQRKCIKVVQKAAEPRSYIVQDDARRKYRRNRRHIVRRLGTADSSDIPITTAPVAQAGGARSSCTGLSSSASATSSEVLTEKGTNSGIGATKDIQQFE